MDDHTNGKMITGPGVSDPQGPAGWRDIVPVLLPCHRHTTVERLE